MRAGLLRDSDSLNVPQIHPSHDVRSMVANKHKHKEASLNNSNARQQVNNVLAQTYRV